MQTERNLRRARRRRQVSRGATVFAVVGAILVGVLGVGALESVRRGDGPGIALPAPSAVLQDSPLSDSPLEVPSPSTSPSTPAVLRTLPSSAPPAPKPAAKPAAPKPAAKPAAPRPAAKPAAPKPAPRGAGCAEFPAVPPLTYTAVAVGKTVAVYDAPGGRLIRKESNPTELGSTRVFLARKTQGQWVNVYLPRRPNGSTGWVRGAEVSLQPNPWRITVSKCRLQAVVYKSGREVGRYPIAVGKAASGTPGGLFYISEMNRAANPRGAYGPAALGLSGYSEVYQRFGSGVGQLALHGTNKPSSIGTRASAGCVRLHNKNIQHLYNTVTLGTPVQIL